MRSRKVRMRYSAHPAAAGATPRSPLDLLLGNASPPADFHECWDWLRKPLSSPLRREGFRDPAPLALFAGPSRVCARERGRVVAPARPAADRERVRPLRRAHNPYIRTIVLRTREYLEKVIDPETGEPFLTPVGVRLHGESDEDAIVLPPFLEDAYAQAEAFCRLLAQRANMGFSAPCSCVAWAAPWRRDV